MKIERKVSTVVSEEIEIIDITLLSEKEYRTYYDKIDRAVSEWWLRTASNTPGCVMTVDGDAVNYEGRKASEFYGAVRPVLIVSNIEEANLKIGDYIIVAYQQWKVIAPHLILCTGNIGKMVFRNDVEAADVNAYESSDIKKWLHQWAKDQMIEFMPDYKSSLINRQAAIAMSHKIVDEVRWSDLEPDALKTWATELMNSILPANTDCLMEGE